MITSLANARRAPPAMQRGRWDEMARIARPSRRQLCSASIWNALQDSISLFGSASCRHPCSRYLRRATRDRTDRRRPGEGPHRRGHRVTLFAPGDSRSSATGADRSTQSVVHWLQRRPERLPEPHLGEGLVSLRGLRHHPFTPGHAGTAIRPVVPDAGRLDPPWSSRWDGHPALLDEFRDVPLVAISESQRRWSPDANWVATVPHGLDSRERHSGRRRGYLAFVGRIAPEKGVADAVALARATGLRLRMAAKVYDQREQDLFARSSHRQSRRGWSNSSASSEARSAMNSTQVRWPHSCWALARTVRAGCDQVDGDWHSGHRSAGRRPSRDHRARPHGLLIDDLQEALLAVGLARTLDRRHVRRSALVAFPLTGWSTTTSVCTRPCLVPTYPPLSRSNRFPVMADRRSARDRDVAGQLGKPRRTGAGRLDHVHPTEPQPGPGLDPW